MSWRAFATAALANFDQNGQKCSSDGALFNACLVILVRPLPMKSRLTKAHNK
jgi:hypothetical protein